MFDTIRPSSAGRIVECPGSWRASMGAPDWLDDYDDTTVRDEGTACHWLAHQLGIGNTLIDIGAIAENGVAVDGPMFEAAQMYLDELDKWPVQAELEVSLPVPQFPATAGTPDAQAFDPETETVYLADLKYGYRVIEAWVNYQMLCYAIAIAAKHYRKFWEVNYHITIIQPRRWHMDGPIRTVKIHGRDVLPYFQKLKEAVENAMSATPRLTPGSQCKHCPGRTKCTALRDTVADGIYVETHGLTFAEAERELKYLERHKVFLDAYISGLAVQVEHGLRNGKSSLLYELSARSGNLEWHPEDVGKVKALAQLMGVKITKEAELITPTQAKERLPVEVVNMYSRRKPGAVKLVPTDNEALKRIFGK